MKLSAILIFATVGASLLCVAEPADKHVLVKYAKDQAVAVASLKDGQGKQRWIERQRVRKPEHPVKLADFSRLPEPASDEAKKVRSASAHGHEITDLKDSKVTGSVAPTAAVKEAAETE